MVIGFLKMPFGDLHKEMFGETLERTFPGIKDEMGNLSSDRAFTMFNHIGLFVYRGEIRFSLYVTSSKREEAINPGDTPLFFVTFEGLTDWARSALVSNGTETVRRF